MTRETITARAHGVDFSRWQEKFIFSNTTGQIDFGIAKISEGSWVDDRFEALFDFGLAEIPIRGLYHYQRSSVSWKLQADNFLNAAERLNPKVHMLAVDVEKINNTMDKTFFIDAKRIFDYLKANSNYKIILYLNPDVFDIMYPSMLKNYGTEAANWMITCPLWTAQYYFFKSPDRTPEITKMTPKPRIHWNIFQYSDKGDSRYGTPDLNVFNGTVTEMRAWLGLGAGEPVPEEPPVVTEPGNELSATVRFGGKETELR